MFVENFVPTPRPKFKETIHRILKLHKASTMVRKYAKINEQNAEVSGLIKERFRITITLLLYRLRRRKGSSA